MLSGFWTLHDLLFVDPPVARDASDAGVEVDAVVEEHVVRQAVHLHPLDGLPGLPARADGGELGASRSSRSRGSPCRSASGGSSPSPRARCSRGSSGSPCRAGRRGGDGCTGPVASARTRPARFFGDASTRSPQRSPWARRRRRRLPREGVGSAIEGNLHARVPGCEGRARAPKRRESRRRESTARELSRARLL